MGDQVVRGQSKRASVAEAVLNTAIGFALAYAAQAAIAWVNNIPLTLYGNFVLTFWMTFVSIARSYVIRRWFNKRTIT
jgi:hypothetical protein